MMDEALRLSDLRFGVASVESAILRCNMGKHMMDTGDIQSAKELCGDALQMLKEKKVRMDCMTNYCAILLHAQEDETCEPYLVELLQMKEEHVEDTNHPHLLPIVEQIGDLYLRQVRLGMALRMNVVIEWRIRVEPA